MRTDCMAQGTLLSALWWPKWEGNPKRGGICIYTADSPCCMAETGRLGLTCMHMLYYVWNR